MKAMQRLRISDFFWGIWLGYMFGVSLLKELAYGPAIVIGMIIGFVAILVHIVTNARRPAPVIRRNWNDESPDE